MFYLYGTKGPTPIAITVVNFLDLAPTNGQIETFYTTLSAKYTLKRLEHPTEFLGWVFTYGSDGNTNIPQP